MTRALALAAALLLAAGPVGARQPETPPPEPAAASETGPALDQAAPPAAAAPPSAKTAAAPEPSAAPAPKPESAAPPPAASESARPSDPVAAARAEADRMIAAAHAEAYFANVTQGPSPQVRHLLSGMVCSFEPGQAGNEVHVYQSNALPGQDVGCSTRFALKDGGLVSVVLYATRYPEKPVLEDGLASMVDSIRRRAPDAQPASGQFEDAPADAPAPHRAVRLQLSSGGQVLFTRAAAGVAGEWFISQRVTSLVADAAAADRLGESGIALAIGDVQHADIDPVELAGGEAAAQDAAEAEVQRLLKSADAADAFDDVTQNGAPRLRHRASGVICEFGRDPAGNRLILSGMGFACAAGRDYGAQTLEVASAPGATEQKARESVAQYMAAHYPEATSQVGFSEAKALGADGKPLPAATSLRFAVTDASGASFLVRVSYVIVGDWLVFQRLLAPEANAALDDAAAGRAMVAVIGQLVQRQAVVASQAVKEIKAPPAQAPPAKAKAKPKP